MACFVLSGALDEDGFCPVETSGAEKRRESVGFIGAGVRLGTLGDIGAATEGLRRRHHR